MDQAQTKRGLTANLKEPILGLSTIFSERLFHKLIELADKKELRKAVDFTIGITSCLLWEFLRLGLQRKLKNQEDNIKNRSETYTYTKV